MTASRSLPADRGSEAKGHRALRFRPDIEGMRAVAIALVLCDHLDIPGFAGGFIGVDVFFVISGFLITSLLALEHDRNLDDGNGRTVSIRGFYGRRARRILPASMVVIAATLVASKLAFNPVRFAEVQVDALWATFFAANLELMQQATDYFAQGNAVSPLQNYWSLAVEEQFYLVWPALLALLLSVLGRIRGRRPSRPISWRPIAFAAVTVIAAISLWWSIVAAADNPAPAYFSPFTRAWELAVGAAIALATPLLARAGRAGREALAVTGAGLIGLSLAVIGPSTAYPGSAALLPVIGSAALITAGLAAGPSTVVATVLGTAPMRFVGRISYSLYLWHWPIIVVFVSLHPAALEQPFVKAAMLTACVAVSWISFRVIEQPFRRLGTTPSRPGRRMSPAVAWMATVALMAAVPIAAWARPATSSSQLIADADGRLAVLGPAEGSTVPSRPNARWRRELAAASRRSRADATELKMIVGVRSLAADFSCLSVTSRADARRCTRSGAAKWSGIRWPRSIRRSVVLYGNSHAGHWDGDLHSVLPADVTLHSLTRPGCHVTTNVKDRALAPDGLTRCGTSNRFLLGEAEKARPGLVVLSAMGSTPARSVLEVANHFRARGSKVLWIGLSPLARGFNKCLSGSSISRCQGPLFPQELRQSAEAAGLARRHGIAYLDLVPFLCEGGRCPPLLRGVPIRSDGNHLSQPVLNRLRPYLIGALNLALQGK